MRTPLLAAAAAAWLVCPAPLAQEPHETGLVEEAGRRLVQLDVTVRGPREVIETLGQADFELAVGGRPIEAFTVDNLCRPAPAPRPEPPPVDPPPEVVPPVALPSRPPSTFLFYFDQNQLTLGGRQQALETARSLASELVHGGNRAVVVSAGREVRVFQEMTTEAADVLRAIGEIEGDRKQWDPQEAVFGSEELRIDEVVTAIDDNDVDRAISLARQYQFEETWRTGKTLRLFSLAVGRLADVDPPKAVLYFADTMRSNAGEHYLSFFAASQRTQDRALVRKMELDTFAAGSAFQKVIEEAVAHGVRLYTIQAEGLVQSSPRLAMSSPSGAGRASPGYNNQRIRDAQDSLVGLARETGGQAFLNGVAAEKIAATIEGDLDCLYLISFDPASLPENQELAVSLRTERKKVELRTKGVLVVQSEQARRASRLLAAFAAPDATRSERAVEATIVPTGFAEGKFTALVQLAVPGSPVPGATWDLGVSLVSRGRVREDDAGRVTISGADVPIVFETQMQFAPGPFELIAVAHEVSSDGISTGRIEGDWPDPDEQAASIGPIAVLQPLEGVFLREGDQRARGSRAVGSGEPARTDLPTAMVGIVCRGAGRHSLRLMRSLAGDSSAAFPDQQLDLSAERCAIFADQIPAGAMTGGGFRYEVRVLDDEIEVATGAREFVAVGPAAGS